MEKILILDSNSILNRAFHALPILTNSKGKYTNGILGFLMMVLKMQDEINAKHIIATFDRKAKTFRHLQYKEYKQGRKSMPIELVEQLQPLKDILEAFNIDIYELDGFEADDLIGTLSKILEDKGYEVYILTGDRDALQLCSDRTKVIITKQGISQKEVYNTEEMLNKYGVTPKEFIDVKALMGDKSDNIPGVKGIGEKKALNLIKKYKSIENLYENLDNMKDGKDKENLIKDEEIAFSSKKLCEIRRDVPIEFSENELKVYSEYNVEKVMEYLREYELKSLIHKISDQNYKSEDIEKIKVNNIYTVEDIKGFINQLNTNKDEILYINCNITGNKISELSIEELYFRFENNNYCINKQVINDNMELVKEIFSSSVKKVCLDSKMLYKSIIKNNGQVNNVIFDIILAEYLIYPGKEHNEMTLIAKYKYIELDDENKYLSINYLDEIYMELKNKLEETSMEELYFEIEKPLSLVLAIIELEGFRVSVDTLNELKEKFESEINESTKKIYNLADEEFNINSPKQLGKILFEKLDLPIIKKTKTGYSTNAEVLEALIDEHEIIGEIINYRHLTKLQSTYIIGLQSVIDKDNKIHTSFNQTVTTTGRLSSTEPNLQNIPIKYPLGREIRKIFIPENENCVILSADYSQIELRVLAHVSKDEKMIEAFKNGYDIHRITASEIFSVDESEVTYDMRNKSKAVNFGIVYGMGDFALSKDLKISIAEAREYMDKYFERYTGVKKYLDYIVNFAKENGYVSTIFNRIRRIPEIRVSNKIIKALGERLAMNTPIQGTAADIIKLAMVKLFNRLNEEKMKSKILLQVHDELILNVYRDEFEKVAAIVKEEMENCYEKILVPLSVNVAYGENWFEAK